MSFRVFLYLLLLFPLLPLSGQDYFANVVHFGEEEGLSHRALFTIFQDKDGFKWMATQNGIDRFDGYQFKHWSKEQLGIKPSSTIQSISQDDEGWLWIKCAMNTKWTFVFFHPHSEEIKPLDEKFPQGIPIQLDNTKPGYWATHSKYSIPVDQTGRLHFGTVHPPITYTTYRSDEGFKTLSFDQFQQLVIQYIDEQGNIWASDYGNIIQLSPTGKVLQSFPNDHFNSIEWLVQIGDAIYFNGYEYINNQVRSNNHIYRIAADGKYTRLAYNNGFDERQAIFFCNPYHSSVLATNNGVTQLLDIDTGDLLFSFSDQDFQNASFKHFDQEGRLWGTSEFGLYRINFYKKQFKTYFSFPSDSDKPFNNSARGITAFENSLLVNFEFAGTYLIDNIQKPNPQLLIHEDHYPWPRPIIRTKDKKIWVGNKKTLTHLDLDGQPKVFPVENHSKEFKIWSLKEDHQGTIWVGTEKMGLAYLSESQDSICILKGPSEAILSQSYILNIVEDRSQKLWLCTSRGLIHFDPITKTVLGQYGIQQTDDAYLPSDFFFHLHQDKDSIFWIATQNGLLKWDKAKAEVQHFTRKDGLANNTIYAVFEDAHNHLWMSSDNGIVQFNKESHIVRNYLPKDGLSHREFNRTAHFQKADGTIYFGGLNGLTVFHPDDFYNKTKQAHPHLVISDFQQFDGRQNQLTNRRKEIRTSKQIVMKPNDSFFQLDLALLTLDDTDLIQYAYQIKGQDQDWVLLEHPTLRLGRLPYGQHTLHIKGRTPSGYWSKHELSIDIKMLKPFYLQYWFISLVCILLISLGWVYNNIRTRQLQIQQRELEKKVKIATERIQKDKKIIEEQAEELRRLDKVKSRFFANVSHELRTPLTLMLGPISSVFKNNQLTNQDFRLLKKAQESGKDLLKLIGSILDLSKMEASKMELNEKPINLFQFTQRIASLFELHAQSLGIRFIFLYQAEKNLHLALDSKKLEIILNNLLSNAIKFTQSGGEVKIVVKDQQNKIQIEVNDKGRGIHPDDLSYVFNRFYQSTRDDTPTEGGTGIGLALSLEFAKMMKGNILVQSEYGFGSTFTLELEKKQVMGTFDHTLDELPVITQSATIPESIPSHLAIPSEAKQEALKTMPMLLIVEDNNSLREYLEMILSPSYQIISAQNGLVALDLLAQNINHIQLIISDIMMPEMDGFQLLKVLKSKDYYRHLPVVMLTARADIKDKLKALRVGVDDYLLKPFSEEELLLRIENLLTNFQNRRLDKDASGTPNTSPRVETFNQEDQDWLENLENHLQDHLKDAQYSISQLAFDLAISERQLRRRLKSLTGLSPAQYFKEIRLQRARQLLEERRFKTVAQTAIAVGFQDASTFSRNFRQRFGKVPSKFE